MSSLEEKHQTTGNYLSSSMLPQISDFSSMTIYGMINIIKEGHISNVFYMPFSKCLIGRGLHCDIRIQKPSVSNEHAVIIMDDKNVAWIQNLSDNGLILNGKFISKIDPKTLQVNTRMRLNDGDSFIISEREFSFSYPRKFNENETKPLIMSASEEASTILSKDKNFYSSTNPLRFNENSPFSANLPKTTLFPASPKLSPSSPLSNSFREAKQSVSSPRTPNAKLLKAALDTLSPFASKSLSSSYKDVSDDTTKISNSATPKNEERQHSNDFSNGSGKTQKRTTMFADLIGTLSPLKKEVPLETSMGADTTISFNWTTQDLLRSPQKSQTLLSPKKLLQNQNMSPRKYQFLESDTAIKAIDPAIVSEPNSVRRTPFKEKEFPTPSKVRDESIQSPLKSTESNKVRKFALSDLKPVFDSSPLFGTELPDVKDQTNVAKIETDQSLLENTENLLIPVTPLAQSKTTPKSNRSSKASSRIDLRSCSPQSTPILNKKSTTIDEEMKTLIDANLVSPIKCPTSAKGRKTKANVSLMSFSPMPVSSGEACEKNLLINGMIENVSSLEAENTEVASATTPRNGKESDPVTFETVYERSWPPLDNPDQFESVPLGLSLSHSNTDKVSHNQDDLIQINDQASLSPLVPTVNDHVHLTSPVTEKKQNIISKVDFVAQSPYAKEASNSTSSLNSFTSSIKRTYTISETSGASLSFPQFGSHFVSATKTPSKLHLEAVVPMSASPSPCLSVSFSDDRSFASPTDSSSFVNEDRIHSPLKNKVSDREDKTDMCLDIEESVQEALIGSLVQEGKVLDAGIIEEERPPLSNVPIITATSPLRSSMEAIIENKFESANHQINNSKQISREIESSSLDNGLNMEEQIGSDLPMTSTGTASQELSNEDTSRYVKTDSLLDAEKLIALEKSPGFENTPPVTPIRRSRRFQSETPSSAPVNSPPTILGSNRSRKSSLKDTSNTIAKSFNSDVDDSRNSSYPTLLFEAEGHKSLSSVSGVNDQTQLKLTETGVCPKRDDNTTSKYLNVVSGSSVVNDKSISNEVDTVPLNSPSNGSQSDFPISQQDFQVNNPSSDGAVFADVSGVPSFKLDDSSQNFVNRIKETKDSMSAPISPRRSLRRGRSDSLRTSNSMTDGSEDDRTTLSEVHESANSVSSLSEKSSPKGRERKSSRIPKIPNDVSAGELADSESSRVSVEKKEKGARRNLKESAARRSESSSTIPSSENEEHIEKDEGINDSVLSSPVRRSARAGAKVVAPKSRNVSSQIDDDSNNESATTATLKRRLGARRKDQNTISESERSSGDIADNNSTEKSGRISSNVKRAKLKTDSEGEKSSSSTASKTHSRKGRSANAATVTLSSPIAAPASPLRRSARTSAHSISYK